jgi:multiple sugar transport system permease protein
MARVTQQPAGRLALEGLTRAEARQRGLLRLADLMTSWAFLAPNLLGVIVFVLFPVVASFLLAFAHWQGSRIELSAISWAGLANFGELLSDDKFWQSMWNTLILMLGVPLRLFACLAVAMVVNQRLREVVLYRTLFFLPTISSATAIFILWQALYNPDVGLINRILGCLLIQGPNWLGDPDWAKSALIITGLWQSLGGLTMLLYLAALQGIPEYLYEAAEIDGASAWHKFWSVTWPMLGPTTFFVVTMGVIRGFQGGFQQAYVMTRGGPANSTATTDYFIYNEAFFTSQQMGYASAAAWVMFAIILAATLIQWRYGQKHVHYQ